MIAPPQNSGMFQKFAAVMAKIFEPSADDEKAVGGYSSDDSALLDSAEEVITGQKIVVNKRDHCRAVPMEARGAQSLFGGKPRPGAPANLTFVSGVDAIGEGAVETDIFRVGEDDRQREGERRSPPIQEGPSVGWAPRAHSQEAESTRLVSPLHWAGSLRQDHLKFFWTPVTCRHASIFEWFVLMGTWKYQSERYSLVKKAFQKISLNRHLHFDFDSFSGFSRDKLRGKKEMPDHFCAWFIAPVVLSMTAYELLHWKKASKCEVFLSFAGGDALKNFANSLYEGMVNAGISVYRNDHWLRQNEMIGFQAIESSKISIPILSRMRLSSRCLDKLVQMMERKDDGSEHVVLPIFYRVTPADVRCESDVCDPTVAEKRKRAVTEISSLKGWESDKISDGDEGRLVALVVRKVLIELKKALEPLITEDSVGIKSPMEDIMKFVDSRGSTLYVGIHGEGGVGKTTLAKIIYNKLSEQFDHRSFIHNIAESCKCNGIKYLQSQLIRDMGEKQDAIISSVFKRKKVLILLDDVTTEDQLKALAGERGWFAPGSRILITTREKSVLDWAKVDHRHEHKAMNVGEAMILFARHAFRRDSPLHEYWSLSHDVVSIVCKLPLTLEIIGSYLSGKSQASWTTTIEKLRQLQNSRGSRDFPQMELQDILEIVCGTLESEQKKIFLDIACFLVGSDARIASFMWDASDLNVGLGIEELIFLSLIKIEDNHELVMHDELRDFGRSIVRGRHCNEPDNGSRLWDSEEALKMLDGEEGTANVQGLSLHRGSSRQTVNLDSEQFKKLGSLRFLRVSDANFLGDFNKIFSKLRWLQWERGKILGEENFAVEELAVLDLSRSTISDKWQEWSSIKLTKLKVLNLTGCKPLTETSFLSKFEHLEILILRNCESLIEISRHIGDVKTLVSLDLSGCSSLTKLPKEVGKLKGLKELLLDQTVITDIPREIWSLPWLQRFSLQGCRLATLWGESIIKLESLTELVLTDTTITELPESIESLQNLRILNIRGTGIKRLPHYIGNLSNLTELDASWCGKLVFVTGSIRHLSSLQRLDLRYCSELRSLPKLPSKLTVVSVTCKSKKLPSFAHLIHLKQLRLHNCNNLKCIPELPRATFDLEISRCAFLECLSQPEAGQVSLKRLDIIGCEYLERLDLSQLNLLRVLYARDCSRVHEIGGLDKLKSLESLTIQVRPSIELDPSIEDPSIEDPSIEMDPSFEVDKPFSSFRRQAYY